MFQYLLKSFLNNIKINHNVFNRFRNINSAIIILILIFLSNNNSFAQGKSSEELFKQANDFYIKGDFLNAIKSYEEIVSSGKESSQIYFNLGNSYYKLNKISSAILFFERAKRLSPNDEDINFNLKISNLKVIDKIEPLPVFFLYEWIGIVRNFFSGDGWAEISIVFSFLSFGLIIVFLFVWQPVIKKLIFVAGICSIFILICSYIFANQQSTAENTQNTAIIFATNINVKASPEDNGTDIFVLHEGTKVIILDEVGVWKKIRLANGNVGWLQQEALVII